MTNSDLKIVVLLLVFFGLSGCAQLDQISQNLQQATAPVTVTESLSKICQDIDENKIRANEYYKNKTLSATGEISLISKHSNGYTVLIESGPATIHADTPYKQKIINLSTGTTVSVSGVISRVDFIVGCSISLKNATFN